MIDLVSFWTNIVLNLFCSKEKVYKTFLLIFSGAIFALPNLFCVYVQFQREYKVL